MLLGGCSSNVLATASWHANSFNDVRGEGGTTATLVVIEEAVEVLSALGVTKLCIFEKIGFMPLENAVEIADAVEEADQLIFLPSHELAELTPRETVFPAEYIADPAACKPKVIVSVADIQMSDVKKWEAILAYTDNR